MTRRGRFDIAAEILSIATEGVGKTRIMFKANLSYNILVRSLRELQERHLIECVQQEGSIIYRTTEKGRLFLHSYKMIADAFRTNPPIVWS